MFVFFFQAEDGIRDVERSRGLGDVYKRQDYSGIYFYHLQPYVRDYAECQIEDVGIDEMIVFRVI